MLCLRFCGEVGAAITGGQIPAVGKGFAAADHSQVDRTPIPAQGLLADHMGVISAADHSSSGKGSGSLSRGWATDRLEMLQANTARNWGLQAIQHAMRFSLQSLIADSLESSR
jgi:hypothetical protein